MKIDKRLEKAFELIEKAAEQRKMDAGMSGRHDDGGYSDTMEKIETFKEGMRYERANVLPDWIQESVRELERQEDPEYAEYLRLKEKFK